MNTFEVIDKIIQDYITIIRKSITISIHKSVNNIKAQLIAQKVISSQEDFDGQTLKTNMLKVAQMRVNKVKYFLCGLTRCEESQIIKMKVLSKIKEKEQISQDIIEEIQAITMKLNQKALKKYEINYQARLLEQSRGLPSLSPFRTSQHDKYISIRRKQITQQLKNQHESFQKRLLEQMTGIKRRLTASKSKNKRRTEQLNPQEK